MRPNQHLQGMVPTETVWALQPEYLQHYRALSPQLYSAMRNNPKEFSDLARAGAIIPVPNLALGLTGIPLVGARGNTLRRIKPKAVAEPEPDAEERDPAAYYDDEDDDLDGPQEEEAPYDIIDGVATLSISGPMTLHPTSAMWLFGGTSTVIFRRLLAHAERNPRVGAILIDFHTPGGTASGTADLADDIVRVAAVKPVEGFVANLCASAGYWAICGCRWITIGRAAMVGSLGVFLVVEDYSKMYTEAGIKVIVVRHGQFKGMGEPGTVITEEQIAEFQREIEMYNDEFRVSVMQGRHFTEEQMDAVNTGQVWMGQRAVAMGLADEVGRYPEVLARLAREVAAGGLVTYNSVIPGGTDDSGEQASGTANTADLTPVSLLPIEGPGSGYPKTDHPLIALVGAAQERHELQRGVNVLAAHAQGVQPAAEAETPTPGESEPVTPNDAGEGEPAPAPVEESTDNDTPPAETAAGEDQQAEAIPAALEGTNAMSGEQTPPAANINPQGAGINIDPELVALLATTGITNAAQLRGYISLAADGQTARSSALNTIKAQTARLQGGAEAEGLDLSAYAGMNFASLEKIAAQLKTSADAMLRHPDPAANTAAPAAGGAPPPAGGVTFMGQGNNQGYPGGMRITVPSVGAEGLAPHIAAALHASGATAVDPTGTGATMVDPLAAVERLNKEREGAVKTS